ncbi:MAG: response regulator [Gemmatimonadota bacterium]
MNPERVLLVDDETVFADNMATLLKARGYRVKATYSGEAAIRELEENQYDVLVLDLKMPGLDGIATLKEIKKLELFIETLILTGHGAVDSALEAMKLGAYDYLTKPCEIDELVEKIQGAGQKKAEEESKDREEKVQKIIESPRDAFRLFSRKKK